MIDLNKLPVQPKPADRQYTEDEIVDAIINEEVVRTEIYSDLSTVDHASGNCLNLAILLKAKDMFPEDKFWESYSEEAWNVNQTVKETLEKFRIFFRKMFNYIGSFVVLRVKASTTVIQTWENTLKDSNHDKKKVDQIFEDLKDTKYPKVDDVVNCINKCAAVYQQISEQVNTIKTTSNPPGDSEAAQNNLQKMTAKPTEYENFMNMYKQVTDALPSSETKGETGDSYIAGKWNDVGGIGNLVQACQRCTSVLLNIKRLQANCDAIVSDLSKPKDTPDEGLKNLNTEKIKYLKTFSKDYLRATMSAMVKLTSLSAKACNTFNGKYSTKPQE